MGVNHRELNGQQSRTKALVFNDLLNPGRSASQSLRSVSSQDLPQVHQSPDQRFKARGMAPGKEAASRAKGAGR